MRGRAAGRDGGARRRQALGPRRLLTRDRLARGLPAGQEKHLNTPAASRTAREPVPAPAAHVWSTAEACTQLPHQPCIPAAVRHKFNSLKFMGAFRRVPEALKIVVVAMTIVPEVEDTFCRAPAWVTVQMPVTAVAPAAKMVPPLLMTRKSLAAPEPPQAMELAPASQQPSPGEDAKAMDGAAALPLGKSEGPPPAPAVIEATEPPTGCVCAAKRSDENARTTSTPKMSSRRTPQSGSRGFMGISVPWCRSSSAESR